MNTGQVYRLISIICYILSGLTFAFTVFLFFRYKIVNAFNVLSGRKLKQDMDRLSHLSGAASEVPGQAPAQAQTGPLQNKKKKAKKKKDDETEALYGMAATGKFAGQSGAYDTEDWQEGTASDAPGPGGKEASAQLYQTEVTEELSGSFDGTEELDVVVTEASDTELL